MTPRPVSRAVLVQSSRTMPDWLTRLRDMVWPAVLSAVLVTLNVILALWGTESLVLGISLGSGAIAMAILATRE